jgi:hypothetical protein
MSNNSDYYEKTFKKQVKACRQLERLYSQYNFVYPKTTKEDGGRSFDCIVEYKDKSSKIKVEIEIAVESNYWKFDLPLWCWHKRGCSVPERKCHGGRFDVYIKFNDTLDSFFAATDDYIDKVGITEEVENCVSDQFRCNTFSGIPVKCVKNDGIDMAYDDFDKALPQLLENQLKLKGKK